MKTKHKARQKVMGAEMFQGRSAGKAQKRQMRRIIPEEMVIRSRKAYGRRPGRLESIEAEAVGHFKRLDVVRNLEKIKIKNKN